MHDSLSPQQIQSFITDGFVSIDNAFSADLAREARNVLWKDIPADPDDSSTWTQPFPFGLSFMALAKKLPERPAPYIYVIPSWFMLHSVIVAGRLSLWRSHRCWSGAALISPVPGPVVR